MATNKKNSPIANDDAPMAAEAEELAIVPTEILADWVTDRGHCLWMATFGELPAWPGGAELDRELATRMCGGCPVRAECLELELRAADEGRDDARCALHPDDLRTLHGMWSARRWADIEAMPKQNGDGA